MDKTIKMNIKRLKNAGVVPVVVLESPESAIPTAQALFRGGIDVMEITMRTAAGIESIRRVSEACPEMMVGAGTVISLEQCRQCVDAGAKFIVSPGYREDVVHWCLANGVLILPGCVTPSEIMTGMQAGLSVFKFFPANVYGGIRGIQALSAPFKDISFVPTGGIDVENMGEYLAEKSVLAVGGSWLCSKADIAAGNYQKISELARLAKENVKKMKVRMVKIGDEMRGERTNG